MLLEAVIPRDELTGLDVEPLDKAEPDDDWLREVTTPLEDPETALPVAEDTPEVEALETTELLDGGVATDDKVEDALSGFVYWLGGDTMLEELPLP